MKTSSFLANFIAAIFIVAALTAQSSPVVTTSILTLTEATPLLREQNYCVSKTDGAKNVPLLLFNAKSEGVTKVEINIVNLRFKSGSARPSTLYLFDGTTLLSSAIMPADTNNWVVSLQTFVPIEANAVKTFTVKADFPANTPSSVVQAELKEVITTTSKKAAPGKPIIGPTQHLMPIAADIQLAAMPTTVSMQDEKGHTRFATATFTLHFSATGGDILKLKPVPNVPGKVIVVATTADGAYKVICPTMSVVTIPNTYAINDGSTATVVITATLPSFAVKQSGLMYFYIARIIWATASNPSILITQTWGFEDFKTPNPANFVAATNAVKR